jgi:hypothetical protein
MRERWVSLKKALAQRYESWSGHLTESQFATIRAALVGAGVIVVGLLVFVAVRPMWNGWRQQRAMAQAVAFAEDHDYRNSVLALKRAAELGPADLATWKAAADRLAELGAPQALIARENAMRVSGGEVSMRLAWVADALRFGEVDTAKAALEQIDRPARADAAFHRLAASVAMATGETTRLDEHLAALVAAEPENVTARFNLNAVRLWDPDAGRRAGAVENLEKLTAVGEVRVRAGLELLKHAARVKDAGRARHVVDLLLDRMGVAPALRVSYDDSPPGWNALVQGLQETAVRGGPADVALVARWMGDVRMGKEALRWLETIPPDLLNAPAVRRLDALLSAEADDRRRLERLLEAGALGPLSPDAIRLAIAARVEVTSHREPSGRSMWDDALAACGESVTALSALATLADCWRDGEFSERALQEVLRRNPRSEWAYNGLRDRYAGAGDSVRLWQLHGGWLDLKGDDSDTARAWLSLGAVLNRLTPDATALALRRAEAATAQPIDYALAAACRWRNGAVKDAGAWLDKVPVEARGRADVVFWRAVVFADDSRRRNEARDAAILVQQDGLLPEEKALLVNALKR